MSSYPNHPEYQAQYPMTDLGDRSPPSDDDGYDDKDAPPSRANGGGQANNRACDYCHRMKMKCIGKENPPCNRCRQSKHPCTFDGPRKSKSSKVEDRLRLVEAQIGAMQGSINELLTLQRGAAASATATATARDPSRADTLDNTISLDALLRGSQQGVRPDEVSRPYVPNQTSQPNPVQPLWSAQQPAAPQIAVASPASSDENEHIDPLKPANASAPWANMLHLAEAARLKADSHIVTGDPPEEAGIITSPHEASDDGSRPLKRARIRTSVSDHRSPTHSSLVERGNHLAPDPVDLGWCSAAKGKELFDLFFERCGVYMPCFDPEFDTWESLRKRSPFAITTIIAVASKCQEAGGPPSDLQLKCREHAEQMGMSTLFTPVSKIEIVQAMIILASWGETFWRPGGHAIRIAMDMGLHKSLAYLIEGGVGQGKSEAELEAERPVVAGARVWLTLSKLEYEMSFAYGRPGLFCAEALLKNAREFLRHPLSLPTDARLVSSCECLLMRMPLHQPFALAPSNAAQPYPGMDAKLREVNRAISDWYDYWDSYYAGKGVPKEHFLRETLVTGAAGSFLGSNSYVIHGVRNRRDLAVLSDERRQWLQEAGQRAQQLVAICLRGQQYTRNIQYANLLTHYHIAYAARFLIRMATLLPESCNLRQTGRDVEQIAAVLMKVPGFQFAQFLRDVVKKARRDQVLPPASRAPSRLPSPAKNYATLPWDSSMSDTASSWSGSMAPGAGVPLTGQLQAPLGQGLASHDDFLYAEQLFANTGLAATPSQYLTTDAQATPMSNIADQGFSLDAWFPFPPLENEFSPLLPNANDNLSVDHSANNARPSWWS